MKISIVIPVYKNKEMFMKNLRHNYRYLSSHEVIVVDDYSEENVASSVESEFPKIITIENKHNMGFGSTVNRGVEVATGEFIVMMGTDVILNDDSYEEGARMLMRNKELFGVSFAQKERDGLVVGRNTFYKRRGFIFNKKVIEMKEGITGWADGGSSIMRRSYFKELKGFDRIFSPFYHEDNDLSYRAAKRGWRILFSPKIEVEHHHESTIGKYFTKDFIRTIAYRNHFIFMWKNLTDFTFQVEHLLWLPYYLCKHLLMRDWPFLKGFIWAIYISPQIIRSWIVEKRYAKRTDRDILKALSL